MITPKLPKFIHGGDYNPDQWLSHPEILKKDIELMKKAKCNCMSIGIFAWAALEPREGEYHFEWLDKVIDDLYQNGIYTILATPSGARPVWLAKKYPEVLRVGNNRVKNLYGERHNHCYTSSKYREKVGAINEKLAKRYGKHPGVIMWHISNEYGGECHCKLCQEAFREWLREKYKNIEVLNEAWWTGFWSHHFNDFSEIESPAPHGDMTLHGMNLDWKRFVTDQTIDFMKHEIASVRKEKGDLPVTTNFMWYYKGLNYFKFKEELDVISWDAYPKWHSGHDKDIALATAFWHDVMRSIKKQPFMLMESTPSMTNWQELSKLKKPGMHLLASMQAIAHGSDTVQYFQWRKSRGSSEKLHGAVVDHYGESDTRVFADVTEVGEYLEKIQEVYGLQTQSEVAIVFDWENWWAVEDSQGPRNIGEKYIETVLNHYRPLWEKGISVDVVDMACNISEYKMVIAPMLYMLREEFIDKVKDFVKKGGTFVTTYWSGIVNETDLCFFGGFPGKLKDVLGIWSEEIDALYDDEENGIEMLSDAPFEAKKNYKVKDLCELIHLRGAKALAIYTDDFYKGRVALTHHQYGEGNAYYIASRNDIAFQKDLYHYLIKKENIRQDWGLELLEGVTVTVRGNKESPYLFVQNYTKEEKIIHLEKNNLKNLINNKMLEGKICLQPYGISIIKIEKCMS